MSNSEAEMEFAEAIANHVAELHSYDPDQIAEWISEHEDLVLNMKPVVVSTHRLVKGIITEMHGEEIETAIGTQYAGGFVEKIDDINKRQKRVLDRLENGAMKMRLSKGAWAAVAAIIVQLGFVSVAIIRALSGGG